MSQFPASGRCLGLGFAWLAAAEGKIFYMRALMVSLALCFVVNFAVAQPQGQSDSGQQSQNSSQSDRDKSRDRSAEAGESSSRDTRIDLSPPKDEAKDHPNSPDKLPDTAPAVGEMHSWNPYRAVKDDEVGDYYFKEKNYKAALARYQDALDYKPNDAIANFRLGQCYEKLNQPEQAIVHYHEYLKILPEGPYSKQVKKALEKLGAAEKQTSSKTASK
jgi:tetratricopeptide (TPR) repeat protein